MTAERAKAARAVLGRFHMPRTIRTERLQLGPLDMAHEPSFRRFYRSEAAVPMGGGPQNAHNAWRAFAAYAGQWFLFGFGMYAITTRDGAFAGYCGLWFPENKPEIELGWGLFPRFRGQGYATEAARAVKAIAVAEGVPSLVSYIVPDNHASAAVAKRLGASHDGMIEFAPGYTAAVWRHRVPTPDRLPDAIEILLETNVMPLSIGTPRLQLAPLRAEHFERYADHEADADAMRYVDGAKGRYDAWRKFAATLGQWALRGYGLYAVEADGEVVGRVGLYHPAEWPERELGWHIYARARGHGYATESAAAVRAVAVEQGLRRLVSYIAEGNSPSVAVAQRLGAQDGGLVDLPVGTARQFVHPMVRRATVDRAA